jgi:N6-adenosine-specific RNA methylase IME4
MDQGGRQNKMAGNRVGHYYFSMNKTIFIHANGNPNEMVNFIEPDDIQHIEIRPKTLFLIVDKKQSYFTVVYKILTDKTMGWCHLPKDLEFLDHNDQEMLKWYQEIRDGK